MLRCLLTTKIGLGQASNVGKEVLTRAGFVHVHPANKTCWSSRLAAKTTPGSRLLSSSHGTHEKPVTVLQRLLSDENVRLDSPELETAHDIKSLYLSVKSREHLNKLSAEDLTALIRLFGSLSVFSELPNPPSVLNDHENGSFSYHPLTSHLAQRSASGPRAHWAFVLTIAKDKQSRGIALSKSDSFWLMRAALEDLKRLSSQTPRDDKHIMQCMSRALNYYLHIQSVQDWTVHKIYFEGLLAHGGAKAPDEVIYRLGNILRWNRGLHWRLHDIVWRVLALHRNAVSSKKKTHFLHALRDKVSKVRDVLPMLDGDNQGLGGSSSEEAFDVLAVRNYFVHIIFSPKPGFHPALRYLKEVYPWVLFETRAALRAFNDGTYATSEEENDAAWNNLVLLSLSFRAEQKGRSMETLGWEPGQSIDGVHSQGQVLGWTVICALAALLSEINVQKRALKGNPLSSSDGFQDMVRTLWILWRKEEAWRAGAVPRGMALVCSTAASFMVLASASNDARLASSLVRHVTDSVMYPAMFEEEVLDRRMLIPFAVHLAAMNAAADRSEPPRDTWERILAVLRSAQLIPDGTSKWASIIARGVLQKFIRSDSTFAYGLYASAAECGMSLDEKTILALGIGLASDGHLELAFLCLKDDRLSKISAQSLLDVLLSNVLHHRHHYIDRDLARAFADVLTHTTIRPTNSLALERVLRACIRARHINEVFDIIQAVNKSEPSILRSRFLAHFVSTLVSHRRYRLLSRMVTGAWRRSPSRYSSAVLQHPRLQYIKQLLAYSKDTNNRLVTSSLPFSIYQWPLLRNHIPFHPRLAHQNKKIVSLKLSTSLRSQRDLDEKSLESAILMLVKVGRITAALKLLDRLSPTISTKVGNIILSASLLPRRSRRHRRQVRHASMRLSQLVQKRGFVPDRVTLNLVMKALLRWESITPSKTLRVLFDKIVENGYPGPMMSSVSSTFSREQATSTPIPPSPVKNSYSLFGTDASSAHGTLPVDLGAFQSDVSFNRHTRPLYKMFVQAFKARGDRESAHRVIGVLRELQARATYEQEKRELSRRAGRMKARNRDKRKESGDESRGDPSVESG
ncbi:hypothetical protein DFH11DRAFT_1713291 [Phellopilus nigrolimitatus]|nr:hypothetical protein DFH11DRAFT_1713291 [Phellopilus nigrolimitatus]